MSGQRAHVLVVDVQVADRGRRGQLRRSVEPEPVDHEVVQRLDLLDSSAGILVEELAQPAFAACLLELAVPRRCVAPAEEAPARALDAVLVAVADPPAATVLRLVGRGVRAILFLSTVGSQGRDGQATSGRVIGSGGCGTSQPPAWSAGRGPLRPSLIALGGFPAAVRGSSRRPLEQRASPHDELSAVRLPGLELAPGDRPAKRRLRERHERDRVRRETSADRRR